MQLPGVCLSVRRSVCLSRGAAGECGPRCQLRLVVFPRVVKKLGKGSVVGAVYGWTTWPTGR